MRQTAEKSLREVRLERDMLRVLVIRLKHSLNSTLINYNANEADGEQSNAEEDDGSINSNSSAGSNAGDGGLMFMEGGDAMHIGEVAEDDGEEDGEVDAEVDGERQNEPEVEARQTDGSEEADDDE